MKSLRGNKAKICGLSIEPWGTDHSRSGKKKRSQRKKVKRDQRGRKIFSQLCITHHRNNGDTLPQLL